MRSFGRVFLMVLVLLAARPLTRDAAAQTVAAGERPAAVARGDRVRLWLPAGFVDGTPGERGPYTGAVTSARADTLIIWEQERKAQLRVPWTAIERLEISQGRKVTAGHMATRALGGAVLGAALGAVIALGVAEASESMFRGFGEPTPTEEVVADGALIGGALGLAGGVYLGLKGKEAWAEVPVQRVRVGLWPEGRDGVGVRVTIGL